MLCVPQQLLLLLIVTSSAIELHEELIERVVFGPPMITLEFNTTTPAPVTEQYVIKRKDNIVVKPSSQFAIGVAAPVQGCPANCKTVQGMAGSCVQAQQCHQRGGVISGSCCGTFLVCCQIAYHCGDSSKDELASFQSVDYPLGSQGTLACDFDLHIRRDTCAVRIDFFRMKLFKRFGGVCDVDQMIIINSVDGPTSAQCGDLTGYSTTVAVRPAQKVPLKLVLIIQNEDYYLWDMRLQQVKCSDVNHFRRPLVCGSKQPLNTAPSFYQFLDLWRNTAWQTENQQSADIVWWREPPTSFHRFQLGNKWSSPGIKHPVNQFAEERIIGGTDADLHEFPWEVAIILKRMFFCAGSLINEEFVLSAAHCFLTQDTAVGDLVVFLGDHDLTQSNDTLSDIRGIKQIHFHAHFHALRLSNDIALLQLDRPVTFSHRVRPICLPEKGRIDRFGGFGVVAGWGITTYPEGRPSPVLQKLDVELLTNQVCENTLKESLGPGNLCAVPRGRRGTCFGDSGGPLSVNYNGKETLIGIVSFGITGCAMAPQQPDLYTRVSEYLRWIDVAALNVWE